MLLRSIVCALGFAAVAGAQGSTISIHDAVAEALRNNPGLAAERLGVPVAETAAITARLRPNPVLSYSSDHLDALGTGFNEVNSAGPAELALRFDLPWERGHKREFRVETAAFQARIAREKIAESERRLTLEVTLACIDVMEAKARLALANDNLQALQRLVTLNQNRVAAGAAAPVELTRSRVAMLQFRAGVKTAELALNSARLKLQALMGRRTSSPLVDISDDLEITLPAGSPNLDRLLEIASTARPEIRTVQLDQARSQADLRLQLAQGKVDYTFGAEYRRQQGVNGRGNSLGFFVSAPLPVFNRNQGEIARVHAEQEQIRQTLEALRTQVSSEVSSAWQDFDTTRTLLQEIERDLLGPSREARNTTAYVYQAGASSLIDVLDAQRAFNETMSTYYGAQADYRRAATRLAAAAGQEIVP